MQNYYYFNMKSSDISNLVFKCLDLFEMETKVRTINLKVDIHRNFYESNIVCVNEKQAYSVSKKNLHLGTGYYINDLRPEIHLFLPAISLCINSQIGFKTKIIGVMAHEFKHHYQNITNFKSDFTLPYMQRPHEINARIFEKYILNNVRIMDILINKI